MSTIAGCTEPTLGEHLRDEALARVLDHVPPGDPWRRRAVELVAQVAAEPERPVFEAYDLVRFYELPEPDHPSRWGAIFRLCALHGLIEYVGAGPSHRPTVKGSLVKFWRGSL